MRLSGEWRLDGTHSPRSASANVSGYTHDRARYRNIHAQTATAAAAAAISPTSAAGTA
jgi:hypothetical protein